MPDLGSPPLTQQQQDLEAEIQQQVQSELQQADPQFAPALAIEAACMQAEGEPSEAQVEANIQQEWSALAEQDPTLMAEIQQQDAAAQRQEQADPSTATQTQNELFEQVVSEIAPWTRSSPPTWRPRPSTRSRRSARTRCRSIPAAARRLSTAAARRPSPPRRRPPNACAPAPEQDGG
jgi:hypothetical protein